MCCRWLTHIFGKLGCQLCGVVAWTLLSVQAKVHAQTHCWHLFHITAVGEEFQIRASRSADVATVLCGGVLQADFRKAKEKVLYKKKEGVPEGLYM